MLFSARKCVSSDVYSYVPGEIGDTKGSFLLSWLNATRVHRLRRLRKTYPREAFFYVGIVNAHYEGSDLEVMVSGGIIQPPLFSTMGPDAVNYGGLGMVIYFSVLRFISALSREEAPL